MIFKIFVITLCGAIVGILHGYTISVPVFPSWVLLTEGFFMGIGITVGVVALRDDVRKGEVDIEIGGER